MFNSRKPAPKAVPAAPPTLEERLEGAQGLKASAEGVIRSGVRALDSAATELVEVKTALDAEVARLAALADVASIGAVEAARKVINVEDAVGA